MLWLDEPQGLEDAWRRLSSKGDRSHRLWTEDYLAAMAEMSGARLVTFDRVLRARYPTVDVVVVQTPASTASPFVRSRGKHLEIVGVRRPS